MCVVSEENGEFGGSCSAVRNFCFHQCHICSTLVGENNWAQNNMNALLALFWRGIANYCSQISAWEGSFKSPDLINIRLLTSVNILEASRDLRSVFVLREKMRFIRSAVLGSSIHWQMSWIVGGKKPFHFGNQSSLATDLKMPCMW